MLGSRKYVMYAKKSSKVVETVISILEKNLGQEGTNWMCYLDRKVEKGLVIEFAEEKYQTLFQMASSGTGIRFRNSLKDIVEEEKLEREYEYIKMKFDARLKQVEEEIKRSMDYNDYLNGKL